MKIKKTPGQVVVIITIFVAVIILLSVVLINIGKISDIKTSTAQIADSGALNLASQWSMYCNTLSDTMMRKAESSRLLNILYCSCSPTRCECINWGLIIPLAAVFLSIVLMPLALPISLSLYFMAINPLWTEVDSIMKSGFQSAAAQNTQYAAMRETAIESMLSQVQFDPEKAERDQGDVFRYRYGCLPQPSGPCIPQYYYYDLTESPVAASIKNKENISRYAAWYWGERYPKVSEAGLGKEIKLFIDSLLEITEFNHWDPATWNYTEVSLKVDAPNMTCNASECPDWAVYDKKIVRIIAHINTKEPTTFDELFDLLNSLLGGTNISGFLPMKFTELTKRLLDIPLYRPIITYASINPLAITIPFFNIPINLGASYDVKEIMAVSEAFRGMMLRITELLNIPVAHRIPSLNNWLPGWYNIKNPLDTNTIYGRLNEILVGNSSIEGINVWIADLRKIAGDIRVVIPRDDATNGDTEWGLGSPAGPQCATVDCCGWDCETKCCYPANCSFYGMYCSACGGNTPPICGIGDLYGAFPRSIMCPLTDRGAFCACPCAGQRPFCHVACGFQGDLLPAPNNGLALNEVAQAVDILERLKTAIETLMAAIQNFAVSADAIMNPGDPIKQWQKEAIYGWVDNSKPNRGSLNIVRVNLDNYPSRDDFPYIKESYGWFGFTKVWTIEGQTEGPVGKVTVSRYTSDISVGSWWTLKYRKDPLGAEWPVGPLGGIIHSIQDTGTSGVKAADFDKYAITSATNGYFGTNKQDIRIERDK